MSAEATSTKARRDFHLTVLGRTLEHLGVQMYKRRDVAIAELVANCWDAGATNVWIEAPERNEYDQERSRVIVTDDGEGMNPDQVEHEYLVVGRNRREDARVQSEAVNDRDDSAVDASQGEVKLPTNTIEARPVMGRKGIGKLAGFGVAKLMRVVTWRDGQSVDFRMDIEQLKLRDGVAREIIIPGLLGEIPPSARTSAGTKIYLDNLKHVTPLDLDKLRESLARRFSRRVRGRMNIFVNGQVVGEPHIETEYRRPDSDDAYISEPIPDGSEVRYRYSFAKSPIQSSELRGFTIYVRGKTAQAPPFYFHVEGTASGQHATKYLTGDIEADFLDEDVGDDNDLVSTDRQEIDWENEKVQSFKAWGAELTRRLFREWVDRHGDRVEAWILSDDELNDRIARLEPKTRTQVKSFLRRLGSVETDKGRALELAGSLVRAYEYRHFLDVIGEIEGASEDPEALHSLLSHLSEWNVLESRAILEIIKGRLSIIEKFHSLIVNDVPETKSSRSMDNLHDMLAGQPWLLNPEWQVLSEEKSVTRQLREWGYADVSDEEERERFDFLALKGSGRLVVIEIKRSGHPVTLDELFRLESYRNSLQKAHSEDLYMVMIYGGGLDPSVSRATRENWESREDGELREWSEVHSTTREYYEHYRAVLEGNVVHPDFQKKQSEVMQTRSVLAKGHVHRDSAERKKGLGQQDVNYLPAAPAAVQQEAERKGVRVIKLTPKDKS